MEEELYSGYVKEVFESELKIYDLVEKDIQVGSIEFLIMKEKDYAEYVLEIGIKQNEFSNETNYGGITIELPIESYGFKALQEKTFEGEELIDTHGSFYIVNSYENFHLHKVTFGNIQNQKIEAKIEYTLDYPNWKKSKGYMSVLLNIEPITISNQIIEPVEKNRRKAISILENYIPSNEISLASNVLNLNGFRFEYKIED